MSYEADRALLFEKMQFDLTVEGVCDFWEAINNFYSRNSDRPITPDNMSAEEKEIALRLFVNLLTLAGPLQNSDVAATLSEERKRSIFAGCVEYRLSILPLVLVLQGVGNPRTILEYGLFSCLQEEKISNYLASSQYQNPFREYRLTD